MIGREAALAQMLARWRSVCKNRQSQIIEVVGDAGVGKSRLVDEFCSHPATNGVGMVRNYCHELYANTPLYPLGNFLWNAPASPSTTTTRRANESSATSCANFRYSDANALILASLPGLGPASPVIEVDRADAAPVQARAVRPDRRGVSRLARSKPTILLVEDAHWIDPTSAEFSPR